MRVLPIWSRLASIYLLSLLSIQCRTLPSAAVKSQSVPDEAFSHAKVTDIQLKLDPTAWDNLRLEGNNLSNLQCGAKTKSEYSQVPADVTIDGKSYGTVKIRKKGFFGSLLQAKPSLKIKFPADAPALYFGLNRIVLNNNNQDPALIRQCLAYDLFRAANISSPRCSFARLHVNG
ncbi:MAG: CotH kinase family protein, partial [Proteobacteria bacterium]|nr:CotH kinase family protein [Pseudomonadota bacterium]